MPVWPAIIKYAGSDEVSLVRSEQHWQLDDDLNDFHYADGDMLIDSRGGIYEFSAGDVPGPLLLRDTGRQLSPEQLSRTVQKHLSAIDQCCVSKVMFSDYAACFAMLEQTDS